MNSKIIPHNSKDGVHLIPIAVHPSNHKWGHFDKILNLHLISLNKKINILKYLIIDLFIKIAHVSYNYDNRSPYSDS